MHEEVEQKSIGFVFKGGKVTAQLLAKAMLGSLRAAKRGYGKHKAKTLKKPGRVTMEQLAKETGGKLANIEITGTNIKAFDPVAREFGIRYELKQAENGHLYVFFNSDSADAMTAAFKKFTALQLQKVVKQKKEIAQNHEPFSLRKELKKLTAQVRAKAPIAKTKNKEKAVEI